MDHAVDALREAGEGFLLHLSTSTGPRDRGDGPRHRWPGHCADSRTRRTAPGTRRIQSALPDAAGGDRTAARLRRRLRPGRSGPRVPEGNLRYANAAYRARDRGRSVADALHRNLELLETDQRAEMSRVLNDHSTFSARLPIVVGGERRTYDVQALKLGSGSAGIAHRRQRGDRAARRHGTDGGSASPHPRPIVVGRGRVRRSAAARLLQRILPAAVEPRSGLPRRPPRRFQRARPAARGAQTARAAGLPGLEGQAARSLSRGRTRDLHLVPARRPRRQRRHHAEPRRRRHLSVRQRHRKPRSGAALRRPDAGPARDPRQSRRSGRGVRQQRSGGIVQSRFRENVEAVGGVAERATPHRDRRRLVQAAVRRRADLARAARGDHRDREPRAGGDETRAQGRQRARLHDHAAARRRRPC